MSKHEHDTSGAAGENTILVGDEWVTYKVERCTCGQAMSNTVIRRTPISSKDR